MAEPRKFYQPGISRTPSFIGFLKSINIYTISWILLSSVLTAAYGFWKHPDIFNESLLTAKAYFSGDFFVSIIIMGLIILYIHDKRQIDYPIQRIFPVVIWGRKLLVKMGPLLRQYLFLNDQEETPYNRITRNWVYESSMGVRNTIGFGSQIDMDKVGTTLIMPATFTNTAIKSGNETGTEYK